jgi:hypothetical protein
LGYSAALLQSVPTVQNIDGFFQYRDHYGFFSGRFCFFGVSSNYFTIRLPAFLGHQ